MRISVFPFLLSRPLGEFGGGAAVLYISQPMSVITVEIPIEKVLLKSYFIWFRLPLCYDQEPS